MKTLVVLGAFLTLFVVSLLSPTAPSAPTVFASSNVFQVEKSRTQKQLRPNFALQDNITAFAATPVVQKGRTYCISCSFPGTQLPTGGLGTDSIRSWAEYEAIQNADASCTRGGGTPCGTTIVSAYNTATEWVVTAACCCLHSN